MTLTEFLLARIAEDEAVAGDLPADGYYTDDQRVLEVPSDADGLAWPRRWSPVRVLRGCERDRQIVEEHKCVDETSIYGHDVPLYCDPCQTVDGYGGDSIGDRGTWPCPTLRALAAVYADHPDYDEAWRP